MAKKLASQLFISRLSFYTTEKTLESMFSRFGEVTEARLIKDPKTLRPKGFGFVSFHSEADALRAVKGLNATIVDGRLIFVEFANTERPEIDGSSKKDLRAPLSKVKDRFVKKEKVKEVEQLLEKDL